MHTCIVIAIVLNLNHPGTTCGTIQCSVGSCGCRNDHFVTMHAIKDACSKVQQHVHIDAVNANGVCGVQMRDVPPEALFALTVRCAL